MQLTDDDIMALGPKETRYKRTDGRGLYIEVTPNGVRSWRFKYIADGIETVLTFGQYPTVSISAARAKANEVRQWLAEGLDPKTEIKRQTRPVYTDTFKKLAEDWLQHMHDQNAWSARYEINVRGSLDNHVFPLLGDVRVKDIDGALVLKCIKRMEDAGITDMAYDVRTRISMIFRYGIGTNRATVDYAHAIAQFCKKHVKQSFPALDRDGLPAFFARLRGFDAHFSTTYGLRVIAHTVLRNGKEARLAQWDEIDFTDGLWIVPGWRMKKHKDAGDHIVVLGPNTLELLRELKDLTRKSRWLFPSPTVADAPISDNTWGKAMRSMGYSERATVHGMRTLFSTTCNGKFPGWTNAIDVQLDHDIVVTTEEQRHARETSNTYNRQAYPEQRYEVMQFWDSEVAAAWQQSAALPTTVEIPEPVTEVNAFRRIVQRQRGTNMQP